MISTKKCLVILNAIFALSALVIFIVAGIARKSVDANYVLLNGPVNAPLTFLIIFGVALLLTVMVTFTSLYREMYILLTTHIISMIILVVIEVSVLVALNVRKPNVLERVSHSLLSAEPLYTFNRDASTTWNCVQTELKCCGVGSYDEWFEYLGNSSVPDTCCVVYEKTCGNTAVEAGNFYKTSCAAAISQWATNVEIITAVLFVLLIVLQVFSIPLARRYQRILQ